MIRKLTCIALAAGACLVWPAQAEAAESYDNCTGFIDSLPATIGSQGTWCLRKDLSTAMTSGNAITIATNNVTLDCNDFKIGGLGAGPGTQAIGIAALQRTNTTIRHCNVRGFSAGTLLRGSGHLVEDNTFDSNTTIGIQVHGTGSVIRNNQVLDTGGETPQEQVVFGIAVGMDKFGLGEAGGVNGVDVIDNVISGVVEGSGTGIVMGIAASANGKGSIVGNRISGLVAPDSGIADEQFGIFIATNTSSDGAVIARNIVQGLAAGGKGISCGSNRQTAHANVVRGFGTAIATCFSTGNTVSSD